MLGENEEVGINKCGFDEKFDSLLDSGLDDFSDFKFDHISFNKLKGSALNIN